MISHLYLAGLAVLIILAALCLHYALRAWRRRRRLQRRLDAISRDLPAKKPPPDPNPVGADPSVRPEDR